MNISDPIADLLTRIRNGAMAQKRYVDVPYSKMKESIVSILSEIGFVEKYMMKMDGTIGVIRVFLKYGQGRESVIKGIRRASRPGLRAYVKKDELPYFYGGLGVSVVSTSKGIMTNHQAHKAGVGGELLFKIW